MQKKSEGTAHRPSNEEGWCFLGGRMGGITDYTGRFDGGPPKNRREVHKPGCGWEPDADGAGTGALWGRAGIGEDRRRSDGNRGLFG